MKFAVAVVILAVAISANASHLGLGLGWNSGLGAWGAAPSLSVGAPWGAWGAAPALSVSAPWGAWGGAWNGAIHDGTWTSGHHGAAAAAVIAAPIAAAAHSGSYVAANRGSVHVAPLDGHIQSVKSLNVDPAPGTTW